MKHFKLIERSHKFNHLRHRQLVSCHPFLPLTSWVGFRLIVHHCEQLVKFGMPWLLSNSINTDIIEQYKCFRKITYIIELDEGNSFGWTRAGNNFRSKLWDINLSTWFLRENNKTTFVFHKSVNIQLEWFVWFICSSVVDCDTNSLCISWLQTSSLKYILNKDKWALKKARPSILPL